MSEAPELVRPDISDVDRWIGQPVGGGQMKDPISTTDIRSWVQAMQNPNPIYIDEASARATVGGEFLAPQSFTVCCAWNHAATPAIQGKIPGSHMLFGGDHFWFRSTRIRVGDTIHTSRLAFDYRITDTSFAGPTVFQRGDTTYINQLGETVGYQRSTAIRYLVANAAQLRQMKAAEEEPAWSDEDLAKIDREKRAYYETFHDHVVRHVSDVSVGEMLPVGVIGPHSVQTLTTEWRAYLCNTWGVFGDDGLPTSTNDSGWLPEMTRDMPATKLDPAKNDGLYNGASRGHVNLRYARLIGMPRQYGYGASMGSYLLDYVANWAGESAYVKEADMRYSFPVLVGDVTYLKGDVASVDRSGDGGTAQINVVMSNQNGAQMVKGKLTVSFR
ncbi:MAG: FAS1-like dehydratase domain-containing protein [Acidimicrobiales bacterium]